MAVHVALRGDAGLDAWVAHGAEAGARTQRVAAALRAARARAERALASHDCEAFEAVVSDVPQSNDPFADAPRLCANDYAERARAKHRAARELLRERRRDVRERLASTEAAEKAHRARVDERIAADAAKAVADKHRAAAAADAERRDAAARRAAAAAARKAVADNAAAAKRSASALTPVITSTTATTATTTTTTTTPPRAPPAATAPATVLTSKKTTSASIVAATKPSPAAAAVTQSKKPEWPADAAATRDAFKVLVEQGKAFRTSKDGGTKRARLSLKKAINLAANQVAASQRQVARCVDSLAGALHTAHGLGPAVHAWAVVEVARRLVSDAAKGEQGAAQFALAYVLSGVVSRAPNVPVAVGAVRGVLLEICCYVAPVFPRRRHDEKDSAYRQRIGARDEEGAERYSNRMAAVIGLYGALITIQPVAANVAAPFTPAEGWTWLARVVNQQRQHPLAPAMLVAFLESAGHELSVQYRRQFAKLMAAIQARCLRKAAKAAPPGPHANLENLIKRFITGGCAFVTPPIGKKLPVSDAVNV